MLRSLCVVSLALMLFLSGCRVSTAPRTVLTASADERPRLRRAPHDGEYRLYAAGTTRETRKTPTGEPLMTQHLERDGRLGFRRAGGTWSAVAGDQTFPLEPGRRYLWQMRADAGQTDPGRTAVLVIVIGVAVGIVIGASSMGAPSIGFGL